MYKWIQYSLLAAVLVGCGGFKEKVDTASQAFTNEGQVCSPNTYNPYSTGWPTRGYCQWMSNPHGYNGAGCGSSPGIGEVYVYDATTVSGSSHCARISAGNDGAYLSFPDLAVNGWDNTLNGITIKIKAVWMGPHVDIQLAQGPSYDSTLAVLANSTDTTNSTWVWSLPSGSTINSLMAWLYYGSPLN